MSRQARELDIINRIRKLDPRSLPEFFCFFVQPIVEGRRKELRAVGWSTVTSVCLPYGTEKFYDELRMMGEDAVVDRILYLLCVLDRAGVVHGDFKPNNLLLTATRQLVLTDLSGSAIGARIAGDDLCMMTTLASTAIVSNTDSDICWRSSKTHSYHVFHTSLSGT